MQHRLQTGLIRAQPVILIHLHIEQDGAAGQIPTRDLYLGEPGGGGAVQPAADKAGKRLDPVNGLLERSREEPGGKGSQREKERFHIFKEIIPQGYMI